VPTEWTDLYPNITYEPRQKCLGMISVVDSAIQNITEALKARGLWDNALVIFSSDNGVCRI
jgi:arylsulfatase A-like enzyme